MSIDVHDIVKKWEGDQILYKKLGKKVSNFFRDGMFNLEIYPEINYRVKDLLSIIRKIKKKNLTNSQYSYTDLKDKLGVRIVCSFLEEMDIIDKFVEDNFIVLKADKKREALDHNRLDYISNHYDLKINNNNIAFRKNTELKNLIFEVQIRTLNQHAWSTTSHALIYKQEADIPDRLKRKIFRLLSLYEIADDEFSIVNKQLYSYSENQKYSLLRKVEGKLYKYAKLDFDREISLYTIGILINDFFSIDQVKQIFNEIDLFISTHEAKIMRIFLENKRRYFEVPYLIQPEIFIIWYALEKFEFSITDNWINHFDEDDLEQIRALWGKVF